LDLGFVVVRARERREAVGTGWMLPELQHPRRYQAISRALIPEKGGDRRKGILVGGI